MRIVRIYAWICPTSGVPVYVGKTSQPVTNRMFSHSRMAKKLDQSPKYVWLRSNPFPRIIVLEETSVAASSSIERRWVRRLSRFRLLNVATAGAGNPGIGRVLWTPAVDARLGTVPDSEIASDLGCDRKTVSYRRKCLGIPASFDRKNNSPPPSHGGWNKKVLPQSVISRLGSIPDYLLANEAGVDKSVIAKTRVAAGIQSYAETTGNNGRIKKGEAHRRWS